MNRFPSLLVWQFAVAGLLAATGPIIIHLLTRRRRRRLDWAAMELLLQAIRESERSVRIRDLLLLGLRCLALALFGLALAQPFFPSHGTGNERSQAIEWVLLMDNSMSMAYETLANSRLDRAKQIAQRVVAEAPQGSRYWILPLCGQHTATRAESIPLKEDALAALNAIEIVDRSLVPSQVFDAARRACRTASPLTRRILVFSDLQAVSWRAVPAIQATDNLPTLEVIHVAEDDSENWWVADVRLQDGVADPRTPATVRVQIGSQATAARQLQVTLAVDGVVASTRTITLEAGQSRRDLAFQHTFRPQFEASGTAWSTLTASISGDRLPVDDRRHQVVPVAGSLPVVFVDQYGDQEEVERGRLGETRPLRKLFGSVAEPGARTMAPHYRIEQLNRVRLADARLVVLAGVPDPTGAVLLLREYVEQGGQLLIAAGGDFDAAIWNQAAWLRGQGILPAPLDRQWVGGLPGSARQPVEPFQIDYASLGQHPYFQYAEASPEALREFFAEPFFFQAARVRVDDSDAEYDRTVPSSWLRWQLERGGDDAISAESVNGSMTLPPPQVLARLSDSAATPLLVERQMGAGRVVLFSSGLLSGWTTIAKTNAILILDRVARQLLQSTYPTRNLSPQPQFSLALPGTGRQTRVRLKRPGPEATSESLDVGFVREDQRGVVLEDLLDRGVYQLEVTADPTPAANAGEGSTIKFAVNGAPEESNLDPLSQQEVQRLLAGGPWRLLDDDTAIAHVTAGGHQLWWWLALIVFVLLSLEMTILSLPVFFESNRAAVRHPLQNPRN